MSMPWDEGALQSVKFLDPDPQAGRVLNYADAVREAFTLSMEKSSSVFIMGQGVDDPSAMFGTTRGLKENFGAKRVFDTPVSEEGMTGVAVGAAMNGMRPVLMHNRPDFMLLSFNQLVTHAGKIHYMDEGKTNVPMVVWSAIGRGWGTGAQHSQSIHGLLLGAPGLKIILPSTPADAKGLMISAIEDNNPVLIFEHRWLMKQKGLVPEGYYKTPIGKGVYRRRGSHVTIVGVSHMLTLAIEAATLLEKNGVSCEVIDLRTVKPYDEEMILESVRTTGRLLVVDSAWQMGGLCAEIGCMVAEKAFRDLKSPVRRLGWPDIPTPAGYHLEQQFYPGVEAIVSTIQEMVSQ
jgi:acetoin:2,6-dichlorophenolindophenol oxidoreductase subunit beta